jgi:ParB family chromosome partitioning protein
MSKKALGKGFDSLIPTNLEVAQVANVGEKIQNISLQNIEPNPAQPRKTFDEKALGELANSIKKHGIIQPLVVTPSGEGKYRIVAGERRYRASKLAKKDKVPAIIRNHQELEELEVALVENVQRVDLSPLEQAVSIVRLRDQFSLSTKQIAAKLGKAETTISNIIRLLQLPKEAIEALQNNQITEGHARAILALKGNEKKQLELLNKISTQSLSVRGAEQFVNDQKSSTKTKKSKAQELIDAASKQTSIKMSLREKTAKSGTVSITYKSIEELKRIIQL